MSYRCTTFADTGLSWMLGFFMDPVPLSLALLAVVVESRDFELSTLYMMKIYINYTVAISCFATVWSFLSFL